MKDGASVPVLGDREQKFRAEAATADAYAIKLKNDVAVAFFAGKVYAGGAPLKTWRRYLERSVAKTRFANDATVSPAQPVWVGGVECAVADVKRVTDGVEYRERYYVLPGGDHWAFIKLLATAKEFPAVATSVVDAVEATRGVGLSTLDEPDCAEDQRARLFCISAAVFAVALLVSWVRKRRTAQGRNPRVRRMA